MATPAPWIRWTVFSDLPRRKACFIPSLEVICLSPTGVMPSVIRGVTMTITETAVDYPQDYLLLA